MKLRDKVRVLYTKIDSVMQCAVLYVGATILDNLSSLHFPPGFQEGNPFARHADGTFWLKHALITEGMGTLEALFASASCYVGARVFGLRAAKFAAGLPWLYFGWLHLDAAFSNWLIEIPNLYVETAHDLLRRMLGQ